MVRSGSTSSGGPRRAVRRSHDGHEIDLVLQLRGGEIFGIEVKASERVTRADAVSMARLRDKLGTRFRGGFILHTGPHAFPLVDGIFALPLDRLWA